MEQMALAILLTSTLTTNGLIALWAATSHRHWFLRTALYVACVSPLLWIPAFEPFIGFVLQGAIIAAGVQAGRWWSRRRQRRSSGDAFPSRAWSFSLSTLMFAAILVAMAAAVGSRAPSLNSAAWINVIGIAAYAGVLSLASYAVLQVSQRRLRVLLIILLLLVTVFTGIVMGGVDQFLLSLTGVSGWPPAPPDPTLGPIAIDLTDRPFLAWLATSVGVCVGTLLVVGLTRFLLNTATKHGRRRPLVNGLAWFVLIAAVVALAAPAAVIYLRMATPEPIPIVDFPEPNGYDKLSAAWRSIEGAAVATGAVDASIATEAQLAPAVEEVSSAVSLARQSFAEKIVRPLDYSLGSFDAPNSSFDDLMRWRSLSRAFTATARLQMLQGNQDAALATHVDTIRLGVVGRRGGLVVDGIVGVAITGFGSDGVWEHVKRLDEAECRRLQAEIDALIADIEPREEAEYRDFVWDQYAFGWHGRLYQLLAGENATLDAEWIFKREMAILQLLSANLSLQGFRVEFGRLPADWDEVVAAGWPPLPPDPFDPQSLPLRYHPTADEAGYTLYSVYANETDDNGAPPEKDQWGSADFRTGDLRLDAYFATTPTSPTAEATTDEVADGDGDSDDND
jgi:hypothetical protein